MTGSGEPVGTLMGGKIAQAAVMTTSVASASDPIQPLDARNPILAPHSVSRVTPKSQVFNQNLPTPVNPSKLQEYLHLAKYPEHLTKKLVAGFKSGFSLGYMGSRDIALRAKNLKSCDAAEEIVEVKLAKEIAKGHISEGYDTPPYPNFICSPIGLVPKKVEGEFRLIHHLSYPHGSSVNDGIPIELTSVSYATLDDAIKEIRELGKGAFIAKSDIESAFRLIPIKKQDYHLLGFQWKDEFFFEKVLPMG